MEVIYSGAAQGYDSGDEKTRQAGRGEWCNSSGNIVCRAGIFSDLAI